MTISEYIEFRCDQIIDDISKYLPQRESNGKKYIYSEIDELIEYVSLFISECQDVSSFDEPLSFDDYTNQTFIKCLKLIIDKYVFVTDLRKPFFP